MDTPYEPDLCSSSTIHDNTPLTSERIASIHWPTGSTIKDVNGALELVTNAPKEHQVLMRRHSRSVISDDLTCDEACPEGESLSLTRMVVGPDDLVRAVLRSSYGSDLPELIVQYMLKNGADVSLRENWEHDNENRADILEYGVFYHDTVNPCHHPCWKLQFASAWLALALHSCRCKTQKVSTKCLNLME